ncbi:MAG: RNA polymerase sigma factor [Desulfobacterales bacterium]|nr:RNA polymerase sigma factor [Deltaproteobacteria bacterium]NNK96772.1 RNA polymerase sigma factor [Desulfobacterales bacterium]
MQGSYQQFYSDYKNRLFSYLLYKSRDRYLAEDIAQESFARYYKQYGKQAILSPSLLFAIARNALVDYQRGQQIRFRSWDQFTRQETTSDEESKFISKEQSRLIQNAMNELSESDREILVLAVGGMPYKEIADFLNTSLSNVKVRVHRSRVKIRELLKEWE